MKPDAPAPVPASSAPAVPSASSPFASPAWLLILLPLFLTGLSMPLQSPDEPREAEIARAMYEGWNLPTTLISQDQARKEHWTLPPLAPDESPAGKHVDGSWAVPSLAGRPFLEKPPLYYWCVCACYAVFGVHEFAARLPDALFGFLSCLLIYALVRRETSPATALLSAAVLATMHRFWEFSHTAMIDMVLTGCTTLAFYAYARWSDTQFFPAGAGEASSLGGPPPPATGTPAAQPSGKAAILWSLLFWFAVG
ncbi:MAG TPA: glycosyltransferase family 39 protein, partial [Planctomycetota bacterium]|nr:glycosyltransferase family 39 protein [Planctomycetota bacterium]